LVGRESGLTSPFWSFVRGFNINEAGFAIVGLFVVTWAMALLYWRLARVEEKLGAVPEMAAQGSRSASQGLDGGDPDYRPVQGHTTG
jgi:high-affinity nickel-transport protein